MKKRNRLSALLLAAVLSVSVSACGSSDAGKATNEAQTEDSSSEAQVKPAELLASSRDKMEKISSMNAHMVVDMEMEVGADGQTQSMKAATTMDMSCFYDPLKIKVDMTVDAGEAGSTSVNMYAELNDDGTYTQYVYDGANWQSQTIDMSSLAQYNASDNMLNYMKDIYNFEAIGTEEVDGKTAYKLSGAITGEAINEAVLSSGALDSLASSGIDAGQLDGIWENVDEIPITLWVDEETQYPLKYEMDMTGAMSSIMSEITAAAGEEAEGITMDVKNMAISMTCSDYNEAEEFSIPKEAGEDL